MKIKKSFFLLLVFSFSITNLNAQSISSSRENTNTFIENKGQWPEEVLFLTSINGMDAWITKTGVVYDFFEITKNEVQIAFKKGHVVSIKHKNEKTPSVTKTKEQEGFINYYIGEDHSKWASNVKTYKEITLTELYDNIDLKYYFDDGFLRYDYIVNAGGDPNDIVFNISGSEDFYVDPKGELVFETQFGSVKHKELEIYQNIGNDRVVVNGKFAIEDGDIKLSLSEYDKSRDLIIDPIVWFTYLGGSNKDIITDVTVGNGNNAYVTGYTESNNFPSTMGAYSTDFSGQFDVFVTKLSGNGQRWSYSTYIGGSNADRASGIKVGSNNKVYLVGTTSDEFPILNAYQGASNGNDEMFLLTLDISKGILLNSTYFGGNGSDKAEDIALDDNNLVYILGKTESDGFNHKKPMYDVLSGNSDMIVAKFTSSLNELLFSTYLGSSGEEEAGGIDVDIAENVYIVGSSSKDDFPGVKNNIYTSKDDVIVSKLEYDHSEKNYSISYSSYLGGDNNDGGTDIVVVNQDVYITGHTYKGSSVDFPTTVELLVHSGKTDVFVSKLDSEGNINYSTFLGGAENEVGNAITIDANENVYVIGQTSSSDLFSSNVNGAMDAFYAKYDGSSWTGKNIGGSEDDIGRGIATNGSDVYLVGSTKSSNLPGNDFSNPPSPTHSYYGNTSTTEDGFIIKVSDHTCDGCGLDMTIISEDQTWPDDIQPSKIFGNVVVKDGAILTIKSGYNALFCQGGTLEVEAGGRVLLYGGLTSCGDEWQGVVMHSNPSKKGIFYAFEGSEISNALNAISNYSNGYLGKPVVICNGTQFINNARSLQLTKPGSTENFSVRFSKCDFVLDDDYSVSINSDNQVFLNGAKNVIFHGCQFDNRQSNPVPSIGIYSFRSGINVDQYCGAVQSYPPPPCPTESLRASTIKGFATGVLSDWSGIMSVTNTTFEECAVGIHNSGISGSNITDNVFIEGIMPNTYNDYITQGGNIQIGISYEGGINGMTCNNNYFVADLNAINSTDALGIVTRDLGEFSNLIDKNHFEGLNKGILAQQTNAGVFNGLNFFCNNNIDNMEVDILALHKNSVQENIGKPKPNSMDASRRWCCSRI